MARAGRFEIEISTSGYPIMASIARDGRDLVKIDALELQDLIYVLKKARAEARVKATIYDPGSKELY